MHKSCLSYITVVIILCEQTIRIFWWHYITRQVHRHRHKRMHDSCLIPGTPVHIFLCQRLQEGWSEQGWAGEQGQGLSRAASGEFFLSTPGCGLLAALLVGGRRLPWSVVLGPGGAIAILHGSSLRCILLYRYFIVFIIVLCWRCGGWW